MRLSKSLKQLITNTARDAYAKGVADGEKRLLTGLKAVAQLNGSFGVVAKAVAHAPAGGVTVQGKEYAGGEFIPGEVMARATPAEKAAVEGGGGDTSKSAGGRAAGGGRAAAIAEAAAAIPVTGDRLVGDEIEWGDWDAVEGVMTDDERDDMASHLESAAEEWAADQTREWEPDDDDRELAAKDADWSDQNIRDKAIALIADLDDDVREHIGEAAESEINDWHFDTRLHGVDAVNELADRLDADGDYAPLAEKVRDLADEAEWDTDDKLEEMRAGKAADYQELFDAQTARREYLQDFFRRHDDEPRFSGGTGEAGVWGRDADGDPMFLFDTSAGDRYKCLAYPTPGTGSRLTDFQFSDESGTFSVTGAGNAVEVFSRVSAAAVSLVTKKGLPALSFTAAEESRRKLYDRLVRTVAAAAPEYAAVAVTPERGPKRYLVVLRDKLPELHGVLAGLAAGTLETLVKAIGRRLPPGVAILPPATPRELEHWHTPTAWTGFGGDAADQPPVRKATADADHSHALIVSAMLQVAEDAADTGDDPADALKALAGLSQDPDRLREVLAGGTLQKAWDESLHPRDDSGRFIGKDKLQAAKSDPHLAHQLRAKTTDPGERAKLDKVLSGEADPGRTRRGEQRHQSQQKRAATESDRRRAHRLAMRAFEPGGLGYDDYEELAELLPSLTVEQLRSVRAAVGASWGGQRLRRQGMVDTLVAFARQQAAPPEQDAPGSPGWAARMMNREDEPSARVDAWESAKVDDAADRAERMGRWEADRPDSEAAGAVAGAARADLAGARGWAGEVATATPKPPLPSPDVPEPAAYEGGTLGADDLFAEEDRGHRGAAGAAGEVPDGGEGSELGDFLGDGDALAFDFGANAEPDAGPVEPQPYSNNTPVQTPAGPKSVGDLTSEWRAKLGKRFGGVSLKWYGSPGDESPQVEVYSAHDGYHGKTKKLVATYQPAGPVDKPERMKQRDAERARRNAEYEAKYAGEESEGIPPEATAAAEQPAPAEPPASRLDELEADASRRLAEAERPLTSNRYADVSDADLGAARHRLAAKVAGLKQSATATGDEAVTAEAKTARDRLAEADAELSRRVLAARLRRRLQAVQESRESGRLTVSESEMRELLAQAKDAYREDGLRGRVPYSPDHFRTSDLTGAKVRHFVELPDGRIAHPDELTQAQRRGRLNVVPDAELPGAFTTARTAEQLAAPAPAPAPEPTGEGEETQRAIEAMRDAGNPPEGPHPASVPADVPQGGGQDFYSTLGRDAQRHAVLGRKLATAGALLPVEAVDYATGDGSRHVTAGRAEVVLTNRLGLTAADAKSLLAKIKPATTLTVGGNRKRPGYDVLDLFRAAGKLYEPPAGNNPESGHTPPPPANSPVAGQSGPDTGGEPNGRGQRLSDEVRGGAGGRGGAGVGAGDGPSPGDAPRPPGGSPTGEPAPAGGRPGNRGAGGGPGGGRPGGVAAGGAGAGGGPGGRGPAGGAVPPADGPGGGGGPGRADGGGEVALPALTAPTPYGPQAVVTRGGLVVQDGTGGQKSPSSPVDKMPSTEYTAPESKPSGGKPMSSVATSTGPGVHKIPVQTRLDTDDRGQGVIVRKTDVTEVPKVGTWYRGAVVAAVDKKGKTYHVTTREPTPVEQLAAKAADINAEIYSEQNRGRAPGKEHLDLPLLQAKHDLDAAKLRARGASADEVAKHGAKRPVAVPRLELARQPAAPWMPAGGFVSVIGAAGDSAIVHSEGYDPQTIPLASLRTVAAGGSNPWVKMSREDAQRVVDHFAGLPSGGAA